MIEHVDWNMQSILLDFKSPDKGHPCRQSEYSGVICECTRIEVTDKTPDGTPEFSVGNEITKGGRETADRIYLYQIATCPHNFLWFVIECRPGIAS